MLEPFSVRECLLAIANWMSQRSQHTLSPPPLLHELVKPSSVEAPAAKAVRAALTTLNEAITVAPVGADTCVHYPSLAAAWDASIPSR